MEQKDLYPSIFKRKSIRKYDISALDKNILLKISQQIDQLKPLYPDNKTEIKIVSAHDVKGIIQVKAPHYIAAFSEVKEGYLTNIGFMLQQLDLFFSANGIGSCWQGWPKPTRELRTNKDLEFIIVLAFGMPLENLYRASVNNFKRKTMHQITNLDNFKELLEPARLAPSPSQPWFFTGEKNSIHVFCKNSNGFLSKMSQGLNKMEERLKKIDIGIATCHLWIAALHFNKTIKFLLHPQEKINTPPHYAYIISANIQ